MTSLRQIEANRRNAGKSTDPTTPEGKRRSSRNAVRHGLTAETVIGSLEDASDYKAFEAAITADYDAQSAVERELMLRLASLLWRLRRATTIETGLFDIQARQLNVFRQQRQLEPQSRTLVYAIFGRTDPATDPEDRSLDEVPMSSRPELDLAPQPASPQRDLANCFLRLANLPNFALDRLSRYEATLWRQAGQILLTLGAPGRRRPQHTQTSYNSTREQPIGDDNSSPA